MKALTSSVLAVVLAAAAIAIFQPGITAGVVLSLGAPFALFANVMATEAPFVTRSFSRPGSRVVPSEVMKFSQATDD